MSNNSKGRSIHRKNSVCERERRERANVCQIGV